SRRRHTRSKRDWSSDVCSSDLDCVDPDDDNDGVPDALDCAPLLYSVAHTPGEALNLLMAGTPGLTRLAWEQVPEANVYNVYRGRSEERRVGKECRTRWAGG